MNNLPECRSMNFSIYGGMLDRYKDSNDIKAACKKGGLNGLEVILAGESDQGKILPEMINGVHMYFHIFFRFQRYKNSLKCIFKTIDYLFVFRLHPFLLFSL